MHRICISSSARKRINRITLRMLPSQLMRSVAHRAPARSSPFLSLPMQCKRRKTTPINQPRRAGRGCRGHRRTTAWGQRASVHRGAVRSGDAAFTPAGAAGQDSRASHLTPRVPGLNPGSCHRRDPLSLSLSPYTVTHGTVCLCEPMCLAALHATRLNHTTGVNPAPRPATNTPAAAGLLSHRSGRRFNAAPSCSAAFRKTRQLSGVHPSMFSSPPAGPLVFSDEIEPFKLDVVVGEE
jgi:hypothetical protein